MILIVFAVLAIIGQVLNVFVCLALDNIFSPTVGALSFVLLYMLVFAGAWLLAVRIVESREPAAPARIGWRPTQDARAR
jgi:ABC-type transport system involved in multi-copper enzyme maturation permease subunit